MPGVLPGLHANPMFQLLDVAAQSPKRSSK